MRFWAHLFVLFLSLIGAGFSFLSSRFLDSQMSYIASMFLFIFLLSFSFFIIPRFGSVLIFSGVFALLSFGFVDFGVVGIDRIIVFVCLGLIFEGLIFVFGRFLKSVSLRVVLTSCVCASIVPLLIGTLLSSYILAGMVRNVLNMVLLSFFIGIVGSLISLVVWYYVRVFRFFVRFQEF